jgi:hypothetical protein
MNGYGYDSVPVDDGWSADTNSFGEGLRTDEQRLQPYGGRQLYRRKVVPLTNSEKWARRRRNKTQEVRTCECEQRMLAFLASGSAYAKLAWFVIFIGLVFIFLWFLFGCVLYPIFDLQVKGMTSCDDSMFGWWIDIIDNKCEREGGTLTIFESNLVASAANDEGVRRVSAFKVSRNHGFGFSGDVRRSFQVHPSGVRDAAMVPFCRAMRPTVFQEKERGYHADEDEIFYAFLEIKADEHTIKRMCARWLLAVDYPGARTFDSVVYEAFHGNSGCSKVARRNVTDVLVSSIVENCNATFEANQLHNYLWVLPTSTTPYYTATCTNATNGGLLTLTNEYEKTPWCTDIFSILQHANFSEPIASDTIAHRALDKTIPACRESTSLTLYNSYIAQCTAVA